MAIRLIITLNLLKVPTKWWYGLVWQEKELSQVHILQKGITIAESIYELYAIIIIIISSELFNNSNPSAEAAFQAIMSFNVIFEHTISTDMLCGGS